MITFKLSRFEIEFASFVGMQRTAERMYTSSKHAHGADGSKGLFDTNLSGAIGEYAVCKYLDCNWSQQPDNMKVPDVGGMVEVRSTPHSDGLLRLHDKDPDQLPFALALTHELPTVHLVGWIISKDGKRPEYFADRWNNKRPAYWVPQDKLMPMHHLKTRYREWWYRKSGGGQE